MTQSGAWAYLAVFALMALTFIGIPAIGPAHYSVAALTPASSPNGQLTDITNAMIYSITAFAGYEAAAALGEEARNTRRSGESGSSSGSTCRSRTGGSRRPACGNAADGATTRRRSHRGLGQPGGRRRAAARWGRQ
jgi:hypothetical protein